MKKIKISKKTISSLTEPQMGSIKGGGTAYGCMPYTGGITSQCGPTGSTNPLYNQSCMDSGC